MTKAIAAILASLVLGFVIALFVLEQEESKAAALSPELEARLSALENRLDAEINQREEWQASLENREQQTPALGPGAGVEFVEPGAFDQEPSEDADTGPVAAQRFQQRMGGENRLARLEEAGFAPDQASRILRREQELRIESLYDQWQQRREALLENNGEQISEVDPLRAELGDQTYERYLEAMGRPTSVRISNLMDGAPAAYAGFQAGDEIIRYNGRRVFDMRDLNMASVQGELGEPVVVDVMRDGNMMQLTLERGPLGIISRPGRRRSAPN